jgi:hypothetical protein
MRNDENNLIDTIESAIVETALDSDPAADADAPRDPGWLRWLKFLALIIGPAIVLGVGFVFEDYIEKDRPGSFSYHHSIASSNVEHDTTDAMKFRFFVGACVGGGLGAIYVVRCLVRKTDP